MSGFSLAIKISSCTGLVSGLRGTTLLFINKAELELHDGAALFKLSILA